MTGGVLHRAALVVALWVFGFVALVVAGSLSFASSRRWWGDVFAALALALVFVLVFLFT